MNPLPRSCMSGRKWRLVALILACVIVSLITQDNLTRSQVEEMVSSISVGARRRLVPTFGINLWPNKKASHHYEFVAFKKKMGWHFVEFPCHYNCKEYDASVSVRLTFNATECGTADVVLFTTGPFTLEEWEELHRVRKPGQIWIFATQEPAAIIPDFMPPKVYRYRTFNWSFTFHTTSDIHGAYGWYTENRHASWGATQSKNWHAEKPKLVAWVSSRHCDGLAWDRTKFVHDLNRTIHIDMYGKCGNLSVERSLWKAKKTLTRYKFHLSLENSCCSQYLTEKVWNALEKWQSVPVVIGGTRDEYRRLMPPHSYIHADDFDSIGDLGRYIAAVGENQTLYNKYFAWRSEGTMKQQGFNHRFPVHKEGACKVAGRVRRYQREEDPGRVYSFDPYGPDWFGSCYRCGDHEWIQDYNFWSYRMVFSHEWEDNRTLHWLDGS